MSDARPEGSRSLLLLEDCENYTHNALGDMLMRVPVALLPSHL